METTNTASKRRRILLLTVGGGLAAAAAAVLCGVCGWNGSTTITFGAAARILFDSRSNKQSPQQQQQQARRLATKKAITTGSSSTLTSPLHIDPAVNPILLLGLPKSGSEAIHHFLQCLRSGDWTSQHYCCDGSNRTRFACSNNNEQTCGKCVHENMLRGRPAFQQCHGSSNNNNQTSNKPSHIYAQFDVEAQGEISSSNNNHEWFLPQHFALPLLHRDYPQAVWILNTRDSDKWATNVRHWYSTTVRLLNAFDLSYHDPTSSVDDSQVSDVLEQPTTAEQLYGELQVGLSRARNATEHERRLKDLISIYEQHSVKVRDFARNYHAPSGGHFIEVNVDVDNNGDKNKDNNIMPYLTLARGLGLLGAGSGANGKGDDKAAVARAKACWKYDADALDNDWKDFAIDV